MKVCVVFCTIRSTKAFGQYAVNFHKHGHDPEIIIVDETGEHRKLIRKQMEGFSLEFYGQKERADWFKLHHVKPNTVPSKTTDVIGFSLLVAYPRKYDMIVFLDDDTYPVNNDLLGEHWETLNTRAMNVCTSNNRWINPYIPTVYTRGYPYSLRSSDKLTVTKNMKVGSVLNMGLWHEVPDLNALDYLFHGSLQGVYTHPTPSWKTGFIVNKNCYMPLSRMNIAFKPKIIPAFYQWTGNEFGIGRYGDVFSGLLVQKIAGHLGDNISYGVPACLHDKEPRDVFKDIGCELEAVKLNENFWKILDQVELTGKSYADCYLELADGLEQRKSLFHLPEYITFLTERMRGWVKTVEETSK